ncbi:MAG: sensor histidine kinase, partial [Candidatus Hodarchaeales archaeon]
MTKNTNFKLLSIIGATILTIITYIIFFPMFGRVAGILSGISLIITAVLYGKYFGLYQATLNLVVIEIITVIFNDSVTFFTILPQTLFYFIVSVLIGFFVGWAFEIKNELQDQNEKLFVSEQLLKKQKEELANLASIFSHDTRNKLMAIQSYTEMAKFNYDQKYLDKITETVGFMNEFLEKSKNLADSGKIINHRENIDLNYLISSLNEYKISNDVIFIFNDLPIIIGDKFKIYQVFKNLFENAIKHGQATEIEIKATEYERDFVISISNNGEKISDNIKKSFNQNMISIKKKSGLGLPITKRI